jgi:hypothetical protein
VAHSIARDLQKALVRNSVAAKYLDRLKSTILKHFDVAAYEGKPVNATLLVALVNGAQEKGYQAMLDASEAEAHELATVYGQLTCRRLCEELQQKLPRELRDRVYEQLMEEYMVVDSVEQSDCFQCEDGEDCRIHTHLRSVDYLGIETQTEIAEFWYHISSSISTTLATWNFIFRSTKPSRSLSYPIRSFATSGSQLRSKITFIDWTSGQTLSICATNIKKACQT